MEVTVRLRHSKTQLAATLEPEGDGVLLRMHTPARAPTPGQLAVFYDGDAVVARPGLYEREREDDGHEKATWFGPGRAPCS